VVIGTDEFGAETPSDQQTIEANKENEPWHG